MNYATQCHSYSDIEGEALNDTAGKSTPLPGVGHAASRRWLILASVASVLLVIGAVTATGYGGEHQLDESGLDVVSQVAIPQEEAWALALEASGKIGDTILGALKDIGNDMKQTRQELQAMQSKEMSIAEDKLEQFTAKMARTTAMLVEMESDVHNLYSSLADIFQLNVDDLEKKLHIDDLETKRQAIRDAKATIQAAIDTALEELTPLQKKASVAHTDFSELSAQADTFQQHLERDEQGQSEWFNHKKHDLRAKAYGGCVASLICGPACLAICEGTAAGVLENYLSDLKKEVGEVKQRMQHMRALFGKLGAQCDALSARALQDYKSMGEVKSKLITEKHIANPTIVSFWKSRVLPVTKQVVALLRRKASE